MDKFIIKGGMPLIGSVHISGAKNAALPIMASSILCSEKLTISNIPYLVDIILMGRLLADLNVGLTLHMEHNVDPLWSKTVTFDASVVNKQQASYDLVRKMRASIIVLGPLLTRFGHAEVSLPGGCAIGTRPVDLHLDGLRKMGAEIFIEHGYIKATAPNGLKGAEIKFPKVSVGATQNILMAATLAEGVTVIKNAACEPEIIDLAQCLIAMGAKISGVGTTELIVMGVANLHSAHYTVMPDRIEAATFAAIAGAVKDSDITLTGINPDIFAGVDKGFKMAGVAINNINQDTINIKRLDKNIVPVNISTSPYPGFPTDAQAQFMAMMAVADGKSLIEETVFENRFMHVPELNRMGANITISSNTATINGVNKLEGAEVTSTDLRASSSLIIASLAANDESVINRIYHLDRGYDRIELKLRKIGANIRRIGAQK